MLKCHIVRSLLPSYVDGVLDAESTADVKEHLDGCAGCAAEYRALTAPVPQQAPEPPREINYLRKVHRRSNAALAACAAVVAVALVAGLVVKLFWLGRPLRQSEVSISTHMQDGNWVVSFSIENGRDLLVSTESIYEATPDGNQRVVGTVLKPRSVVHNPFDNVGTAFSYGFMVSGDHTVVIEYADGTVDYDIAKALQK